MYLSLNTMLYSPSDNNIDQGTSWWVQYNCYHLMKITWYSITVKFIEVKWYFSQYATQDIRKLTFMSILFNRKYEYFTIIPGLIHILFIYKSSEPSYHLHSLLYLDVIFIWGKPKKMWYTMLYSDWKIDLSTNHNKSIYRYYNNIWYLRYYQLQYQYYFSTLASKSWNTC